MADLELGNLMFNTNKNQIYECPKWVIALLDAIDVKLEICYKNKYHKEYDSPFRNTGNRFYNDTFSVEAYNWNDEEEQQYNFKCGNIEISWYKYLGRDTTINKEYSETYIIKMFDKCIESLNNMEDQHWLSEKEDVNE